MFRLGTLQIEYGTMLLQIIAFLVLLWAVGKFAMKPAMKVLNERQSYIQNQISRAEEAHKAASELVEEQKRLLNEAKKEALELLERSKAQKDREAEEIIKAAQERADRKLEEAVAEIAIEKNKAIAELRDQVGTLSVLLASKIIEKELDASKQQETINDFLSKVGG